MFGFNAGLFYSKTQALTMVYARAYEATIEERDSRRSGQAKELDHGSAGRAKALGRKT